LPPARVSTLTIRSGFACPSRPDCCCGIVTVRVKRIPRQTIPEILPILADPQKRWDDRPTLECATSTSSVDRNAIRAPPSDLQWHKDVHIAQDLQGRCRNGIKSDRFSFQGPVNCQNQPDYFMADILATPHRQRSDATIKHQPRSKASPSTSRTTAVHSSYKSDDHCLKTPVFRRYIMPAPLDLRHGATNRSTQPSHMAAAQLSLTWIQVAERFSHPGSAKLHQA